MVRDVSRHLLNEQVYDAGDVIADIDGKLRKRGGTTPLLGTASQNFPRVIAAMKSASKDRGGGIIGLGGGTADLDGTAYYGALGGAGLRPIALGFADNAEWDFGRPFQYRNTIVVPFTRGVTPGIFTWGGAMMDAATLGNGFATDATAVVTAGSSTIPTTAADSLLCRPGYFISVVGDTTEVYLGRIEAVHDTSIEVSPTPAVTIAVPSVVTTFAYLAQTGAFSSLGGARCGCAFQLRPVYGNVMSGAAAPVAFPGRVAWGLLPTETTTSSSLTYYGLTHIRVATTADNYIDTDVAEIRALSPIGPSQLLILGADRALRLTGSLVTITTSGQSLPIDVQPISNSVGCLSQHSLVESPFGSVWAARDGVYRYDGSRLENLMAGRIQRLWDEMQRQSDFKVYGSALVRGDHYLLSTSEGGLLCDLRTGAWSRYEGPAFSSATPDPRDATRMFACKWIDPAAALPSATADQVFRLDTLLVPDATNTVDHDGANVEAAVTTKTMAPAGIDRLLRHRHLTANTDLKAASAQSSGNIAGLNADAEAELYLPNADAEFGTTDWWLAVGSATLPTITADTTQKNSGAYSVKVVTVAGTGADDGVRYDIPGGHADAATIYSVEVWVRLSTAGTVSLTVGVNTDTTTTTGSWVRLVARNIPGAGAVSGLAATITHSANSATFWVDDLRVSVLQPWQESGTLLTSGSVVVGDSANMHTGDASIRCVCTTTGHGVNYNLRPTLKKNLTYTASVFAKTISGSTDYTLAFGDGSVNATSAITLTAAWQKFTVSLTPTADVTAPVVAVKRASASAGTFVVDDLAVTGPDPSLAIALVGGPEAEGDYGDGTVREDFATDYITSAATERRWTVVTGATTDFSVSGGYLTTTGTPTSVKRIQHTGRDGVTWRDGRVIVYHRLPDSGTVGNYVAAAAARWGTHGFLEAVVTGSTLSIFKVTGAFSATSLGSTAITALALSEAFWLDFELRGALLVGRHWLVDPAPYTTDAAVVRAVAAGLTVQTTIHLDAADVATYDVAGYPGLVWTPLAATARADDFKADPYDNVGRVSPSQAAPNTTRGDHHLISQASTVQFRQFGQASECEFADVQLQADLLRVGRTS